MELTHIYILFGFATAAALLGFTGYRLGMQVGLRAAKTALAFAGVDSGLDDPENHHWVNTMHKLDSCERELATLRRNIQAEADDHAQVERGLLQRLAAAAPLTDEDEATLLAIAAKLELAADTFAGLRSGDHARFARQLAMHALNMAARLKVAQANTQPHPDSELIEWLHTEAHCYCDGEQGEFRFQLFGEADSNVHARTLLRQVKARHEEIARNHTTRLEAAA